MPDDPAPPSPPSDALVLFGVTGVAARARAIVDKPFGRDLESARKLNRVASEVFAGRHHAAVHRRPGQCRLA